MIETSMNIGIIVNTRSGRNKATAFSQQCQQLLSEKGHQWTVLDTSSSEPSPEVWESDRLIIIGGDGTVHHALPELSRRQIPFYHLATGTSNLIAKELGMPRKASQAVRWSEQGGQGVLDVPTIDSVPFLIMCCLGMDAGIIHRFEQQRRGSGGFRNYTLPVLQEALRPRPAMLRISYDNSVIETQSPSNVVIANMKSYALRINPCPNANPNDSKLDLLSIPCSTTIGWSLHNLLFQFRTQPRTAQRALSLSFKVQSVDRPSLVQMDGEIANTPNMPSGVLAPGTSITFAIGNDTVVPMTEPLS